MVQTISYDDVKSLEDLFDPMREDDAREDVYVFPLSFAQERLWFLDQFEPDSPYYNIPNAVRLSGRLDVLALERALNEIVRRHESLRTTFATMDGDPVQVVSPSLTFRLPLVDMRHVPAAEREAKALRLATEEARCPFDLTKGPLLRATLLRLDRDEHLLLLTMHHIVSDGWSMGVFIQELTALYRAFSSGQPSPLDEPPLQYADFALWQREWLEGKVLEGQLEYWKGHLDGATGALELPTDRSRPAVYTNRGASQSVILPKRLADGLQILGRAEGATSFMTLLAAFQTLLHRYSGQDSISVGSPIANRNRAEIEGLIGFFVNTLVLRADFSRDPTFRELLRRVRDVTLEAYAHQDVPFEMLVDALQVERDMSHTPLFQVMFILQNAPTGAGIETQGEADLTLSQVEVHSGTSTFDLTLSMAETADGIDASIEYNTDLFDAATIERMLVHFQTLLEGIVTHPDQRVSSLPLLTDVERRELLIEWNSTATHYPQDLCIHQLFEAQAKLTPGAVAVVVPANGSNPRESLNYAELNQRANQLAHHLRRRGVGPETVVGVCVERSLEMIVGVLGILKAGGAYLPLDSMYPEDRLAYMLEDSRVSVLLTQASLVDGLPPFVGQIIRLDADWQAIARESDENPFNHTAPEDLVYMIYTSGTMGQSKGVMIQHRSLVNAYLAWEDAYQLRSVRSHLQMANFSFDVFSGDLVRALCSGGKLVVCPREWLLVPDKLYSLMRQEDVDCAEFVPAVLRHLIQYLHESSQRLDFARVLACGSDSWYAEEYRRFLRFCGSETRLINSFGLTEATIDSSYFEGANLALPAEQVVPIGRPFANMRLYVLDGHWQPVPVGVPGELCVGGLGVARGYHDRPALTADRFIPDLFSDGSAARLYRTGDMARYRPDGTVEFLGRLDHQIKIRGFRIEPGEIEAALGRHPGVQQAAVMASEVMPADPSAPISPDKRLAAYVVATEEPGPTGGELRRFVQESLPDYMVPSAFVLMDALPLTPNGKVDREALPTPDWSQRQLEKAYVAPRTATEEMLAGIWTRVLGLERVGVHDNFFELGGHSLLATQVVSRIRKAFEVDLPLRNLFESPTVAQLAERVEIAQRTEAGVQAPPIKPISRDRELPLSFAQQRLWFLDQLEPGSPFYNIPEAVRLVGPLDSTILERTLNEVVRRHEALRTTFKAADGKPIQVIAPELTVPLLVTDLRDMPKAEREDEALRLAQEEARKPFDLVHGPLLRARLLRLGDEEHAVLLTLHHIVGDNWSTGVLVGEVAALYDAFSSGRPSPLPELAIQYADFAHWQRNWLRGEVLEAQLDYWKEQLAGLPPLLDLPTDRPRPPVQTYRGDYESLHLPEGLSQAVKDLCQQEGTTLFMVLLAAFQTLLYRYSGQADISVGSPIANRNRAEIEGLIGFFVNTLVMRTDLSGDPSFRELLKRVRETALGAYAHQDLPFEMIVNELQSERNLSYTPLFQVAFALQSSQMAARSLPSSDLTLGPVEAHSGTAKFDLTLFIVEEGEHLSGALEYSTDLFDAGTIKRMIDHFQTLLTGIVSDPEQNVSKLPLLTEAERHQLLVDWNDTVTDYPQDHCLHQLFEAIVDQRADAVAVAFGEEVLTYQELNRRANQLAHHLQALGIGPEILVGVYTERSLEMVVALLGIIKAGGAYLPMDTVYPKDRVAFMLEDGQVPVLLTQEQLASELPSHNAEVLCLDSDWDIVARASEENPVSRATPSSLAYVIYTSGSTGIPKGVSIPQRAITRLLFDTNYIELKRSDRIAQASNASFDAATFEVWGTLLHGAKLIGVAKEVALSPHRFAAQIRDDGINTLFLTTALFNNIAGEVPGAFGPLKHLMFGGEAVDPRSVRLVLEGGAPRRLLHVYGPTESTTFATWYLVQSVAEGAKTVPIGFPLSNTQIYVLDDQLQPVPVGIPGQLCIGGDGLAQGYLNRPRLTAERFVPNPFSDEVGRRLYETGDLVRYRPDGSIEFLGRKDFQVKVRGFRIELGGIEAVLSQHPAVREALAMVREDIPGEKRVVAYVIPNRELSITVGELRSSLQERLPAFMVPSAFVLLDTFPLNPNGKVDRRALPAPEEARLGLERPYVAPRTPEEEILAGVWAHFFRVERVGIHDNFFELGGHSLLATQLISRLRDAFQLELPLRLLFESPTVAELAESVQAVRREAQGLLAPPIEPVPREGELPLSFAQQRLWFLDQLEPGGSFFNIPAAVRLTGPLNARALERSLNEIVRRHEALRTTFGSVDGRAVQVVAPELTLTMSLVDLQDLSEAERAAEAVRLTSEEARRPFNLAEGPLLRAHLVQLDEEEHIALLNMHHIVSDGWSIGVLVQEIVALYEAFSAGQPSPLPELPLQYADFAHWQRNWLQGEVLEGQLTYWRQQLESSPPLLELPTDRPRPPVQTFRGAQQGFELPRGLTEAMKALSQENGTTPFMTLLAAFSALLYRYTGLQDINLGTPIANRNRAEIEGLIGFFVNTLVMRADLSGDPSFEELLKRVRETALGAYAHQDLPFEMLVDELQPERDMSHSPLFQVMFVLQNAPMQAQALSDLTLTPVEADSGMAQFDLTLSMIEDAEGMSGFFEYNMDLFDAATIERMAGHFQVLLDRAVVDPRRPLSELSLMTERERQQLLMGWNDTVAEYPRDHCVHELFEAQVDRTAGAVAAVFEDDQLTYDELNRRANQLAHHLQGLGVGSETVVGISVERSLEMIVGLLGILKAGGAYLPLDPTYPEERLSFMLEDSQVPVLLTQERLAERLPATEAEIVFLDADWVGIARQSDDNPSRAASPSNLAYVIYTSGSTGLPKGVMLQHRGLCNLVNAQTKAFHVAAENQVLQFASFSFDASVSETFMALLTGATLHLARQETLVSTSDLLELLRDREITTVTLPPSMLKVLPAEELPALETLISAGEACSPEIVARWSPGRRFVNAYGPTEATIGPTLCVVDDMPEGATNVPIGHPIDNTQIYLLDPNMRPVPVGVSGELYVGGVGVGRGYLNRPGLTAQKFVPDPFSDEAGARLYRTGDLARYRPDGLIEFLGRIDHQVKVRGFRIELGEIEGVLAKHPSLQEIVVLAREDTPGVTRLVAYVVPEDESGPSISELRGFLEGRLPDYMVPAAIVNLDTLPLTPSGKVDRRALPAPELDRSELESVYVAPRNPEERVLVGIWSQLLSVDEVGVHDNFFELGGDSILSIQVLARANQAGLRLTPQQLFQHPTVAGLAAVAETAPDVQAEQGVVHGPVPLTPMQRWFFEQELPEPHHWNQGVLLEVQQTPSDSFRAGPEPALLEAAVGHLVEHHDALRLRFEREESGWQQVNMGIEDNVPFTWIDLSDLSDVEQSTAVEATAAYVQSSLDVRAGPLLRVAYFDFGPEQSGRLLVVVHHLAFDKASWPILLQDLQMAYEQLGRGETVTLPAKTTSFQHWSRRLVELAQTEDVQNEADYWLSVSQGEVAQLVVDYPDGVNSEGSACTVVTTLTEEATKGLLEDVSAAYRTETEDTLLTALAQAVQEWAGNQGLLVDVQRSWREDLFENVDLSRTVGWFTGVFPVRFDLGDAEGPGETLKLVKEKLRQLPRGGTGYGLLRYVSADDQIMDKLQALPQAGILFDYHEWLERALPESTRFGLAQESRGPDRSPEGRRSHVLEIRGSIVGARLQLEWTYSENLHRRATIEGLAELFVAKLRSLIAHCQSPEAGGYTPSDFAEFEWSQQDLDDIAEQIGKLG